MIVSPYGEKLCMYCPTFEGIARFCSFLFLKPVLTDLGIYYVVWVTFFCPYTCLRKAKDWSLGLLGGNFVARFL